MTDSDVLRIGTRGSPLALAQTNQVAALLQEANPHLKERGKLEIVVIKTTGDRVQNVLLAQLGGKGLFTKELDEAMLEERIDIAIHSMKDIPTFLPFGITLNAILPREDVRDVLVTRDGGGLEQLPKGARIGTGGILGNEFLEPGSRFPLGLIVCEPPHVRIVVGFSKRLEPSPYFLAVVFGYPGTDTGTLSITQGLPLLL